jgi:two-component system OmpR family sensor kinase
MELQTTVTELPESRVRVQAEVPAEEVERRVAQAARRLGRGLRVPGFRAGKAPAPVIVQRMGREAVLDETVRDSIGTWYSAAISGADPGRRLPVPTAKDEVGRLAETLNGMLQRLETALRRERAFVSDASHELRTPLARLRTELELALRRPRSERELEEALRSAACESDRLARLAEDLLVLARADEDGLPLRRAPVAARDVVTRVAERFAGEAGTAARAIAVEAAEGLGLAADAVRLEQALGNLVANALGHGRGTIRMTAAEHDGRVEFHVIDEGPGFPPQFVPRAFERFARADEARSGGGAGLGLAIVDVIAKAHGGSAHARNRAGGGADVWLSIPRA